MKFATYILRDLPDTYPNLSTTGDHKQPPKHSKDHTDRLFSVVKSIWEYLKLSEEGVGNDLDDLTRRLKAAHDLRNTAKELNGDKVSDITFISLYKKDLEKDLPPQSEILDIPRMASSLCSSVFIDCYLA